MARKKKVQIDTRASVPRGAEHTIEPDQLVVAPRSRDLRLADDGSELVSTEPITMRVKHKLIGDPAMIRLQIERLRATATDGTEFETFAEADDFDVEDGYGEFTSKWEISADNDEAADAYVRFLRTGEIPEWAMPPRQENAPAGSLPPDSRDRYSPPPAPAPKEPSNPESQ